MSDHDLVQAFLARGGKVTRVETGTRTIDETVFARHRGDRLVKVLREPTEQELIDQRIVVGDHVRNGLGEWIA
jgi:hypothetical protein